MRYYISIRLLLFLCIGWITALYIFPAFSQAASDSTDTMHAAQTYADLESSLDSIMNEISTPGAAVAIVSPESVDLIWTSGFADIETQSPVTQNTHFCIGSCTKSFTGLCFVRLMDEGRIDLNMPVREIAPEIEIDNPWEDTDPVRIIHLLEHTAGFDDSHPNWFYFEGPILSLRDALNKKAHLRKVRWRPGTRFSYSSAGFTLAGYILEKVGDRSYEGMIKQTLLEPLGMTTSRVGSSEECRQLLAVGYDGEEKPFPRWYDYDEPAGAMNSSIKEMALFVQFLLNRGMADSDRIISENAFNRIGHPVSTSAANAGLASGYSFGIGTSHRAGAKWLTHGGAVPGFLAEYSADLESGIGYVVLQNQFDVSFYDDLFTRVRDFVESHADSAVSLPLPSISSDRFESYCGYYEPRAPRLQILGFIDILTGGLTVTYENDTLFTQSFMEEKSPLIPVSENLFRRQGDPEATRVFFQTSNGEMAYASKGSYYERTSAWKTYLYRILVFGAFVIMLSSIAYAVFWIPIRLLGKARRKARHPTYISMRVVPLLAVLSLVVGMAKMGDQTMLEFGMLTTLNVVFFASTLLFAALSVVSLYTTFRSFYKPVRPIARVYAVLLSLSCFGMTLYLGYWGVIGLRLWSY